MYVCMCVYVLAYVCMYVYVCTYVFMYVRTYVCMYVCMYACMHACMHAYVHVCMSVLTNAMLAAFVNFAVVLHRGVSLEMATFSTRRISGSKQGFNYWQTHRCFSAPLHPCRLWVLSLQQCTEYWEKRSRDVKLITNLHLLARLRIFRLEDCVCFIILLMAWWKENDNFTLLLVH
jgi:hypothetical protein